METEDIGEQIVQQLLELAQTKEQVNYLVSNNQTVLIQKVNDLKSTISQQDRQYREERVKAESYVKGMERAILAIVKAITTRNDYYDD